MPSAPAKPARQPALVFIFITLFLDILGIGLIVPILPKLVEQFQGGSVAAASHTYGLLAALYGLMQFICSPLLGSLSDRFGRRPVILASLFGSGLDYLLLAFAPNLTWFFIGRLIAGVTGANFSAATASTGASQVRYNRRLSACKRGKAVLTVSAETRCDSWSR